MCFLRLAIRFLKLFVGNTIGRLGVLIRGRQRPQDGSRLESCLLARQLGNPHPSATLCYPALSLEFDLPLNPKSNSHVARNDTTKTNGAKEAATVENPIFS